MLRGPGSKDPRLHRLLGSRPARLGGGPPSISVSSLRRCASPRPAALLRARSRYSSSSRQSALIAASVSRSATRSGACAGYAGQQAQGDPAEDHARMRLQLGDDVSEAGDAVVAKACCGVPDSVNERVPQVCLSDLFP